MDRASIDGLVVAWKAHILVGVAFFLESPAIDHTTHSERDQ